MQSFINQKIEAIFCIVINQRDSNNFNKPVELKCWHKTVISLLEGLHKGIEKRELFGKINNSNRI